MEGANSKAMIAVTFAILLAYCSMPTPVDAGNGLVCRARCTIKCQFYNKECFDKCLDDCLKGSESSIDYCEIGCVLTSCRESSDLNSKSSCADSCSRSRKASYVRA